MKRERVGLMAAVVAGAIVVASGVALAESVWIKNEVVDVRAGTLASFPVVGSVKKGDELTVLQRDGKWIKVTIPGAQAPAATEGWVYEGVVSTTKVDADKGGFVNSESSKVDTSAAAKGLLPGAEAYASGKSMSPAPLTALIKENQAIDPKEVQKFMTDGNVGAK